MSTELIGIQSSSGVNILGLRKGQAELYKYILQCTKDGKAVEMHEVSVIYYTHTKTVEKIYSHSEGGFAYYSKVNALEFYNERRLKEPTNNWVHHDSRTWLKMCLGSFVMRGLLSVVPKFNPEQIKDDG